MLFMAILLFMMVLSIGAISAQDVDDAIVSSGNDTVLTESNSVSGGVDFVTENPWNTTGELSYDIPSDAKTIKSADVYVNVYGGSATNDWGAIANITVTTDYDVTFTENLWIPEGSTDGTVYPVNDHITKCYSDYMIHYDITNMLDGLNGTNLKINVDSFEYPDKKFDGRIKLIALILAYDDGDDDTIGYWINDNQLWTKQSFDVDYNVTNLLDYMEATLKNVVLSSGDGSYKFNDDYLGDADYHYSGDYYQYNEWNVTGLVKPNQPNTLTVDYAGTSTYGSIKNALSLLTINMIPVIEEVSLTPEYTSVPSAYAGTNNTLTIKVKTAKAGTYDIQLFADAVEVDAKTVDLVEGVNTIYLTDPTIRPIDASTVSGAVHEKVEYSAVVFYDSYPLYLEDITLPVLYNGNLGSDYEYNITGFEDFGSFDINGEFIIDIKDASTYMGASVMNRTDVWAVNLVDNAEITNAFIYVPYNWFNAKSYTEGVDMFDATFNSNTVTPIAWYRDQGNLGNYGNYGYGVFVYDVSDLIAIGDNSFVLNKINPTPAVYPSALVYMYNITGSPIAKTVYILNGADLLSNSNNVAKRIAEAYTEIIVDVGEIDYASLYVLAASAQAGESDIVFNSEVYSDVWEGTSSSTDMFFADVTGLVDEVNSISFVATGSTILALPQFIVTTVYAGPATEISLAPEYTSVPSAYAGTNNTLTIKVKTSEAGDYVVYLLADGSEVDCANVTLVEGENTILLTDPTIRPVDATTVNGAENNIVTYTAELCYNGFMINETSISIPVLYNGNLGSDYEYNITGFEDFGSFDINGEFIIDIKDASTYMGASVMNRTDVWAVNLVDNAEITNAFIYVPYNWFNAKSYTEGVDMFDATFNSNTVTPIAWYRDQGNLGNYGNYGYGVFVYDVSDLIAIGDNSFVLNKINPTPAVYPSVLVYMYNVTGSEISRTIYVLNGADLLSNSNNVAKRVAEANTEINVDISRMIDATLCVLAASAQAGESDIVFNGEVYSDVWAGTSSSSDLFVTDVTSLIANNNSISFVATGSTIMALPQFILISKDIKYDTNLTAVYDSATKDLVVTLVDSITGAPLKGANVVVNIAGDNTKVRIAANGEGRLSLADLDYGTYATTLTYKGNAIYDLTTVELDIDVVKAAVNLSAVYDSISKELVVSLVDAVTGAPLKGANVVVNIAGDNTKVRIAANGEGRLSLADLDYGTYATTLTYKGNAIYDLTTVELDIDVVKAAVNLSAVYDSISKELVVSLVDAVTGAPLKGANVIVNIAGEKYTVRIKSNGEGRLSLADLDYGTYAVSLTYKGNAMYALTTVDLDVIVKDAVDLSAVYDSGADELVVSLVDAVTGAPLKGANVVVNINEDTYKVRITSTGQGKLSLAELSPGTYTANATYKGNSLYAPSTIPVDIVKKASDF